MGIHWSFILISIQRDYSDRAYYGIPLVLRYAIFIVEVTMVKFIGGTFSKLTHMIY